MSTVLNADRFDGLPCSPPKNAATCRNAAPAVPYLDSVGSVLVSHVLDTVRGNSSQWNRDTVGMVPWDRKTCTGPRPRRRFKDIYDVAPVAAVVVSAAEKNLPQSSVDGDALACISPQRALKIRTTLLPMIAVPMKYLAFDSDSLVSRVTARLDAYVSSSEIRREPFWHNRLESGSLVRLKSSVLAPRYVRDSPDISNLAVAMLGSLLKQISGIDTPGRMRVLTSPARITLAVDMDPGIPCNEHLRRRAANSAEIDNSDVLSFHGCATQAGSCVAVARVASSARRKTIAGPIAGLIVRKRRVDGALVPFVYSHASVSPAVKIHAHFFLIFRQTPATAAFLGPWP